MWDFVCPNSPRCLLGSLFSRQGSSFPDGALILAVRQLRSVSVIFKDTSAAVPTFSWEVLVMASSPVVQKIIMFSGPPKSRFNINVHQSIYQ